MRKVLFITFLLLSLNSFSHDYFFAFAEIEYDEMNGRIEASVSMTTHDFERLLQKQGIIQKDLNSCKNDTIKMQQIKDVIAAHFFIKVAYSLENSQKENINWKLEGFETQLTGIVHFYLSADLQSPLETIEATFDLMMDNYPEQQNKLTFIYRNRKNTYIFLPTKQTQIIDLY